MTLKCRFCRACFERPAHLEPHIPAIACPAAACQAQRRAREADLERRLAARARSIRPRAEILAPAVLN